MPKGSENVHVEATPHRDGRRDRVINDDTGKEMGVVDPKPEKIELEPDEDMKAFKKNMEKY
ncbi:hypothetical protein LCM20_12770 [Halobacillus litoralis]|uniref:hypothetical protein n=1 Tax=Halobacillus litoralis TaxID=45668 RepID=UPI001CD2D56C|nr:hypothetical protein [Halobacillus litoralis]MCA0971471.1 hypothetical protein [Halobacillus litoralis]